MQLWNPAWWYTSEIGFKWDNKDYSSRITDELDVSNNHWESLEWNPLHPL